MTPEETIKKLAELRQLVMTFAADTGAKLDSAIKDLGQISTCVYDTPQMDRVNADPPQYEAVEVFQHCLAHGFGCVRRIAWVERDLDNNTYDLFLTGTRNKFATIPVEPLWSIPHRAVVAWEYIQRGA